MAELTDEMKASFDTDIAVGEYGTQLFWYNNTSSKFEYALPLVSGGEYGGDTETFDAPEMDLDYVPKLSGRTTLNDVTLTSNYTKDRYSRWLQIVSSVNANVYLEVFSDGSASMYSGTAGRPTIQGGDVRQIEVSVAPENLIWVYDVNSVSSEEYDEIKDMLGLSAEYVSGYKIPFDTTTIPNKRDEFFQGNTSI